MAHTYEIEIKSLLGSEENALSLKNKLIEIGEVEEIGRHSQLNHYFNVPADFSVLLENILPYIPKERRESLEQILEEGKSHSIRTRDADGMVLFVIKASLDSGTSDNTVSRIEFEETVDMTLQELDQLLLDSGFSYQAKWSRDREEYKFGDINITIDKNAGYGYLAEFEKIVDSENKIESAKQDLLDTMVQLEVEELMQDRLERMFEHYNNNWMDYYGTDNIFIIK